MSNLLNLIVFHTSSYWSTTPSIDKQFFLRMVLKPLTLNLFSDGVEEPVLVKDPSLLSEMKCKRHI